jgi:hypothetical protein
LAAKFSSRSIGQHKIASQVRGQQVHIAVHNVAEFHLVLRMAAASYQHLHPACALRLGPVEQVGAFRIGWRGVKSIANKLCRVSSQTKFVPE